MLPTLVMYDWLIVFFIHEIYEDTAETDPVYEKIEKTGITGNNLVFLIKDQIHEKKETNSFYFTLTVNQLNVNDDGKFEFQPVPDLNFDNTDKNYWEQALKYIYTNYDSKRKILITYSHGAAFGINRNAEKIVDPPEGQQASVPLNNLAQRTRKRPDNLQEQKRMYVLKRSDIAGLTDMGWHPGKNVILRNDHETVIVKERTQDPVCKALRILWISDLAEALKKYLPGSQIDILLMVNCYMQLFDNGYILREKVRYMVAPETDMFAFGYDYENLLNTVNTTPGIDTRRFAEQIVDDYEIFNTKKNDRDLQHTAVFANDLRRYGFIFKLFEQLIDYLKENMHLYFTGLQDIRDNQLLNVTDNVSYQLVDAGSWIECLAARFPQSSTLQQLKDIFLDLRKNDIVVRKFIGSDLKKDNGPQYGCTGVSLFYPQNMQQVEKEGVAWCAYFDKSIPPEFGKRSKWSNLLYLYLKLVFIKQSIQPTPLPSSLPGAGRDLNP